MLWRSGYAAVCKTAYTGSIPVGTSIFDVVFSSLEVHLMDERERKNAKMAPFNSNGGASEETLTLDLFLGKEAL